VKFSGPTSVKSVYAADGFPDINTMPECSTYPYTSCPLLKTLVYEWWLWDCRFESNSERPDRNLPVRPSQGKRSWRCRPSCRDSHLRRGWRLCLRDSLRRISWAQKKTGDFCPSHSLLI